MTVISLSENYKLELTPEIIEKTNIHPGQKFQVQLKDDIIELVPIKNIREYRGFLKGMPTDFERDSDRI
jgi:hypothetical protein